MLKHLFKPVDAAILIYFRFCAGILLSVELINSLNLGDFQEYTAPFHFTYLYFEWLKPWPELGLVIHYTVTILAGFLVAFGVRQKLSSVVLFLGYTLLFLMEKSEYINHLYLYCLISFWLIWMPEPKNGKLESPAWYYYLLLFHISVVYFYAGIAKLNPDWLSGNTVRVMLNVPEDQILFFTYGGLLFDLLVVPLLLWKRTRTFAFLAAVVFHFSNVINFGLATFPWFSLMMTAMFFGASWPRKFIWIDHLYPDTAKEVPVKRWLVPALGVYCFLHLLLPLRHHLYHGNPSWTEDGHMFSWRMKLRNKEGDVIFYVVDKESKKTRIVFPKRYLTQKQHRDMVGKPDSILQFAHFLKKLEGSGVSVHASSRVSLNGAPVTELVDVKTDLSLEKRKLESYDWVFPERQSVTGGRSAFLGQRD